MYIIQIFYCIKNLMKLHQRNSQFLRFIFGSCDQIEIKKKNQSSLLELEPFLLYFVRDCDQMNGRTIILYIQVNKQQQLELYSLIAFQLIITNYLVYLQLQIQSINKQNKQENQRKEVEQIQKVIFNLTIRDIFKITLLFKRQIQNS
ncbi:hypothetical protein ABPG72_016439 [Tetrahymena utriculariae]